MSVFSDIPTLPLTHKKSPYIFPFIKYIIFHLSDVLSVEEEA